MKLDARVGAVCADTGIFSFFFIRTDVRIMQLVVRDGGLLDSTVWGAEPFWGFLAMQRTLGGRHAQIVCSRFPGT